MKFSITKTTMTPHQSLPEEGMMLNADLPQPLGSSVVRKLKANCTFKLLILEGGKDKGTERNVRNTETDTDAKN